MKIMKLIPLLLLGILFTFLQVNPTFMQNQNSGQHSFEHMWNSFNKELRQQHLKDADAILDKIIEKAKAEHEKPHLIKARLYELHIKERTKKGQDLSLYIDGIIELLESEEDPSLKAMCRIYLARAHAFYGRRYLYRNSNKPSTTNKQENYSLWSEEIRTQKILALCLQALQEESLDEILVSDFTTLMQKKKKREYQYNEDIDLFTLRDVLYFEVIRFLEDNRNHLGDFSIKEKLSSPQLFAGMITFTAIEFPETEEITLSTLLREIQSYLQDIHSGNESVKKAIFDLERIDLMKSLYTGSNEDSLEMQHAILLFEEYEKTDAGKLAFDAYLNLFPREYDWSMKSSEEIYDAQIEFIEKHEEFHSDYSASTLNTIKEGELSFQIEEMYASQDEILVSFWHHNISDVTFYIHKIEEDQYLELIKNRYDYKEAPYGMKISQRMLPSLELPIRKGLRDSRGEYLIGDYEPGYYVLNARSSKAFKKGKPETFTPFRIFDIRPISQRSNDQFLLLDAKTGEKLEGVDVEILQKVQNKRGGTREKVFARTSNENGEIQYRKPADEYRGFNMRIFDKSGESMQFFNFYQSKTSHRNKATTRLEIYTDRAIYRPGQTVHFKLWNFRVDNESIASNPIAGKELKYILRDANRQEVKVKTSKTDEYGTLHDQFHLPEGLLPGRWTIDVPGLASFPIRVEEYKRPTYKVELEKPMGLIALGDKVKIEGTAEAYAGYGISDANVEIQVRKEAYFYSGCYWIWPPRTDSETILQTSVKTDGDGKFSFELPTLKEKNASYHYIIEAEVHDISGESHSNLLSLYIGDKPRRIEISGGDKIVNQGEKLDFNFDVYNAVNKKLNEELNVQISRLKVPTMLPVKRKWTFPDTIMHSKKEFEERVPYYAYESEGMNQWEEEEHIYNSSILSQSPNPLDLRMDRAGTYRIKVSHRDGASSILHFQVPEKGAMNINSNEIILEHDAEQYKPGDVAKVSVFAPKDWHLHVSVYDRNQNLLEHKWLDERTISIPIQDSSMGGVVIKVMSFHQNRFYTNTDYLSVPFRPYDMQIETLSIDEVMKPGELGKWKFRITDSEGNPLSGRMTASLYDASLDALTVHNWNHRMFSYTSSYPFYYSSNADGTETANNMYAGYHKGVKRSFYYMLPSQLIAILPNYYPMRKMRYSMALSEKAVGEVEDQKVGALSSDDADLMEEEKEVPDIAAKDEETKEADLRENLNELVFFYPELEADENGEVEMEFTMNDALTEWKLLLLGQTIDMKAVIAEEAVKTQKELMLVPQFPRFLREGDEISLQSKLVALESFTGDVEVRLQLFNPLNGEVVDENYDLQDATHFVNIGEKKAQNISWKIHVPPVEEVPVLQYKITAVGKGHSDAIADELPVLSKRVLLRESKAFYVREHSEKKVEFRDFQEHSKSISLEHGIMELQYNANPAWEMIKSLAYQSSDRVTVTGITSNIYSRSIGRHILDQYPRVKEVFENWKRKGALKSDFAKDQELKNALLQETPWVLASQSEEERRQSIALFFELNQLQRDLDRDIARLQRAQLSDGSFPWIEGGRYGSPYITQKVLFHLIELSEVLGFDLASHSEYGKMTSKMMQYLHGQFEKNYAYWKKHKLLDDDFRAGLNTILYFNANEYFNQPRLADLSSKQREVADLIFAHWKDYDYHRRLYLGKFMHFRNREELLALIESFTQTLTMDEELGAYYKGDMDMHGFRRSSLQNALLIDLLSKTEKHTELIPELQLYILQSKRTQMMHEGSYYIKIISSFLLHGSVHWLNDTGSHQITWADEEFGDALTFEAGLEFVNRKTGAEIVTEHGTVTVKNNSDQTSWGGIHWTYMEDMDKVQASAEEGPLSVKREMFIRTRKDNKEEFVPIAEKKPQIGDVMLVRLEVHTDRKMDFVHLQNYRPAGTEPREQLSNFHYGSGLRYYQVSRDLSTDFYIDALRVGTYVFTYELLVTQEGEYSSGLSRVQSYYAPEMSSQSEGMMLSVGK